MKGEEKVDVEQMEKLQECVRYLKEQIEELNDLNSQKDIDIIRIDNDLRDCNR